MNRRDLLMAGLAGLPGARTGFGFPMATTAKGRRLVLNGVATFQGGWWSGDWCRVALYRELVDREPLDPEAAAEMAGRLRMVEARFLRDLALDTVVEQWQARLSGSLPPAFRAWLRPVRAGDVERQLFLDGSVVLEAPGRLVRRIDHVGFARQLLDSWIGPEAGEMGGALRGVPA